jgi:hypothetical protein
MRIVIIILSTILAGLLLFLSVARITKKQALAARTWTTTLIMGIILVSGALGAAIGGIDSAIIAYKAAAAKQASATIPSYVTVRTADGEEIDIFLSWDVLGQDPVYHIDWGKMETDTTNQTAFWIKNAATVDVWLTMNMSDWLPPDANETLTLRWDRVNLNDWRIISGDWAIVNDELHASSVPRGTIVVREDPGFNYEISTRAKVTFSANGRPEAQVAVRYRDSDNYYFCGLGGYGYKAAIGIYEAGSARMLASGGNPDYQDVLLGQWYDLKVRVAGSTITVYVDGQEVCTVDDSTHGFGGMGLTTITSDVAYDDFIVVDAFNPENVIFAEYFAGPVLPVTESEKVTLFLDVGRPDGWTDFSFNIVITAWDEAPP